MTDPTSPPLNFSLQPVTSEGNTLEQIRVLVTHPFFTGQCPQCHHKIQLIHRAIGHSHCLACGWSDEPS
ncbi:hypothetical protein GS597_04870 [Synechococcales cyanobacterium C]|uniref:Transposase n=1 Tax=Petrachloros mirabilis ULC683 TaxID=2781853 RepID=A0A8K1ZXW5_9CYAN|nr:hypothetical protein [Petrachloros mirabilis]NCJ05852.1 hypothetical protein [Petrachloros mirabilis ULC683]